MRHGWIVPVLLLLMRGLLSAQDLSHPWLEMEDPSRTIGSIDCPTGFVRRPVEEGSFGAWLRNLPLKKEGAEVLLHTGIKKSNQSAHFAVLDIDVGEGDLQQCADAVIRLVAEYHYSRKDYDQIHFNFTSGDRAKYGDWAEGFRPVIGDESVHWIRSAQPDYGYANFRKYLNTVFMYAGTYSLSRELIPKSWVDLAIGDVIIQGGFPGHAVLVVDMADSPNDETIFLLTQSYMPAQDIHVLNNSTNMSLSPWYRVGEGDRLVTPEWNFDWDDLRGFQH